MSLAPGSSLLNFRLVEKIGEGGMGEVWKATDTTLGRDVAIKILPAEFAADQERLARFEREAKLLASLNHPNIAGIYGLHESGGVRFLAMELVPGDDLAKKGTVPFSEVTDVARQIAEALEAAHDQGVIHRDLKPANVRITPEGKVKVLDFGLAKALESATTSGSGRDAAMSPTITSLGTVAGVILGTAAYMSPEQARGKPVDKRADIWAFGCLVFEMLAGSRPFEGETISDTLAAVLAKDPNWTALPATTPPRMRELLRRCLEKDVKKRLRDIHDVRIELDEIARGGESPALAAVAPRRMTPIAGVVIALVSITLGALGAFALLPKSAGGVEAAPIRATMELPAGLSLITYDRAIALSPDGSQVAMAAYDETKKATQIFLRRLSRLELRTLDGTEDASYPFWSPDGHSLGFFADGKLKRIELADGIVRTLCDAPQGRGGAWSPRGFIVFAPGAFGALKQVPDGGGTPAAFTKLKLEGETQRLPRFLPGGRRILYVSKCSNNPREDGIYAFDPDTNGTRQVLESDAEAVYVEPGYLAFVHEENLMLQPFDAKRLELMGTARPIASGAQYDINRNFVNLDLSPGGHLVYQEVLPALRSRLIWLDRTGSETPVAADPLPVLSAAVTPDGRQAALTLAGDHGENRIGILDLERGIRTPFGDPKTQAGSCTWSPDGRLVAFAMVVEGGYQLAVASLAQDAKPRILTTGRGMEYEPGSFSLDGRELLLEQRRGPDKVGFLMAVDVEGHSLARELPGAAAGRYGPRLSPDARWLAFMIRGERPEVSLVAFPEGGAAARVTTSGAQNNEGWGWLSERELYWVAPDNHVWAVTIAPRGRDADVGTPRPLLGGRPLPDGMSILTYVRARDRFLAARLADSPRPAKLVLVSDWKAELSAEGPNP